MKIIYTQNINSCISFLELKLITEVRELYCMTEEKKHFNPVGTLQKIEAQFEMFQVLNENGEVVNEANMPDLTD